MKLRELFQSTSRDGADDPARLREAIAQVEKEREEAHQMLSELADRRTDALLDDDIKTIDALDRAAQRAHLTIEQSEIALPKLQERLSHAQERESEAARKQRADAAKAKAADADKALRRDYQRLCSDLLSLIAKATEAHAEVEAVNRDLPVGYSPIELPPALARGATHLPEEIVSEEIVTRWVSVESGKILDQANVKPLSDSHGIIEGHTGNIKVVRRSFRQVHYRAEFRDVVERLDQLLVLPGLFAGSPAIWQASSAYAEDAVASLQAAASEKRNATPIQVSRPIQTRLEPI